MIYAAIIARRKEWPHPKRGVVPKNFAVRFARHTTCPPFSKSCLCPCIQQSNIHYKTYRIAGKLSKDLTFVDFTILLRFVKLKSTKSR